MTEYELNPSDVEEIREQLANSLGFREDDIRPDYSGRGMFGKTCLGFVGHDCTRFAFELAVILARSEFGLDDDEQPDLDALREALDEIVGPPSTDSMATQTIFYWPNITVAADDPDEAGFRS